MVINTNTTSLFAQRTLAGSNTALGKSLGRLASGSKIVSPEDDAAGLAISMKFKAEINRTDAARSNVGNMISFSQTQDGYLDTVNISLRRMSELATLAHDQTKSTTDVQNYKKEFDELRSFIADTAGKTFNGEGLFATTLADNMNTLTNGDVLAKNTLLTTAMTAYNAGPITTTLGKAVLTAIAALGSAVKVVEENDNASTAFAATDAGNIDAVNYFEGTILGTVYGATAANSDEPAGSAALTALVDAIQTKVAQMYGGKYVTDASDATSYQVKGIDISALETDVGASGTMLALSKSNAESYVGKLTTHIETLAGNRAYVGANISRLNMVDSQLAVYGENLGAANSRIADVDVAIESANYAKQQILVQSGTAMLAQANSMPQLALQLLQ